MDVFAVSTYFTVSVLFWYTGLVPDLATLRDRCDHKDWKVLLAFSLLAGAVRIETGATMEMAYLLLAGLSTPLVLSVHSVVSFDFATTVSDVAHDNLAVTRCRRNFRWLCHGADAAVCPLVPSSNCRMSLRLSTSTKWRKHVC